MLVGSHFRVFVRNIKAQVEKINVDECVAMLKVCVCVCVCCVSSHSLHTVASLIETSGEAHTDDVID